MHKGMHSHSASGRTGLGQCALVSGCREESNSIGFAASACLYTSAGCKREIPQGADVRQSREGSHWGPLAEGNRMVYSSRHPHA